MNDGELSPVGGLPRDSWHHGLVTWPRAESLETPRFLLEPLAAAHVDEMVQVLQPEELYRFTGGEAPTREVLQARYARQMAGHSPDGDAGWLNWIIRARASGRAIGFVQATLTGRADTAVADMAWLVTPTAQGSGAAIKSGAAVLAWLHGLPLRDIRAAIHPEHAASARVAERLGFTPTREMVRGEVVWVSASETAVDDRQGQSATSTDSSR